MKFLTAVLLAMLAGSAFAADKATPAAAVATHRYIVERTFPRGALDGLDSAKKAEVNRTNARFGVRWLTSYANADQTRTFCVYEGPDEGAIRNAATANSLPVDSITEVPVTLDPR
jgi:hypothetical protein